MKQFYVYFHYKPDDIPFYVGKGNGRRAWNFSDRSEHHKRIVAKYGRENIKVRLQLCADEQEALDLEMLCIQSLREDGILLCNVAIGGQGSAGWIPSEALKLRLSLANKGKQLGNKNALGYKHTEETKLKLKLANTGRKKTPEEIAKIAKFNLGNKYGCGHKVTEEHKNKIRKAHVGKIVSDETRLKQRLVKLGKKASKETIEKLRKIHTGRKNTETTINKMKASALLRWENNRISKS